MSETVTLPVDTPPLVSTSYANQATAAGSGAGSMAFVVLVIWILGLWKIAVPPEVATAMTTLVAIGVHAAVIKYGFPATVGKKFTKGKDV